MRTFRKFVAVFIAALMWGVINPDKLAAQQKLSSPDGRLVLQIEPNKALSFSVTYDGKPAFSADPAGLELLQGQLFPAKGTKPKIVTGSGITETTPVVPVKFSHSIHPYNRMELRYGSNFAVEFRVYNDGVAYRFHTSVRKPLKIRKEDFSLDFPEGTGVHFPRENSLYSHYERLYQHVAADSIPAGEFCSLPVLFTAPGKLRVLFTEAGLSDYPNAFLEKAEQVRFRAKFPEVVLATSPKNGTSDRTEVIDETAGFIAYSEGTRSFPWRLFVVTDDDRKLAENDLVNGLSDDCRLEETAWIRPGKVAWDWYNSNNLTGVNFRTGINTDTYKYYIDFASYYGLEYVILDEGWSESTTNVLKTRPEIDLPELISYGKSKNVGIILWLLWHPLNGNEEKILSTYREWGVKGIKVDFMQRADQGMVNSYEKIAQVAAENHLLVDFHGSFKPAGLSGRYPNVLTYEGVAGNENNKWSDFASPGHNVTLPFIRMVAGPMDYTPGAMRNAQKADFCISFDHPESLGTRSHQVAMYVVYESPLQMLCDLPSLYRREPQVPGFISQIPVTWDETCVLEAEVGEYIVTARRKGDTWYLGAMTGWNPRKFSIGLNFLGEGKHKATIFRDGPNADKNAEDYLIETKPVVSGDHLILELAPGGGWAAIFTPEK